MMRIRCVFVAALSTALVTACGPGDSDLVVTLRDDVGASTTKMRAQLKNLRAGAFVSLNEQPIPSSIGSNKSLRMWISPEAEQAYRSGSDLPAGGMVIREVLQPTGSVEKVTAMMRAPRGQNPEVGDYWFAVANEAGEVMPDAEGHPQIGALSQCASCHVAQKDSGFLYRVFDAP
jgi:hypothetical protein